MEIVNHGLVVTVITHTQRCVWYLAPPVLVYIHRVLTETPSSYVASTDNYTRRTLRSLLRPASDTSLRRLKSQEKATRRRCSRTFLIFANECTDRLSTRYNTCLQNWVPQVRWMAPEDWSSRANSSRNKSSTFWDGTSVRFPFCIFMSHQCRT